MVTHGVKGMVIWAGLTNDAQGIEGQLLAEHVHALLQRRLGGLGRRDTIENHTTTQYGHTHFFGLHHLEDSSKFRPLASVDDDTLIVVVKAECVETLS